ncbi:MAG TPA: copper resistance protein B [Blastocatellia bacterium]|nr:copper resistance protein B [Blastocatellia bacterium]
MKKFLTRAVIMLALAGGVAAPSLAQQERPGESKPKAEMPGMKMPARPKPSPTPAKPAPPQQDQPPEPALPRDAPRLTNPPAAAQEAERPLPSMGTAANETAAPRAGARGPAGEPTTLPNLSEQSRWPSPVADSETYSYVLLDLLEFHSAGRSGFLRWDVFGWRGGDRRRLWFKSEGTQNLASSEGEADFQILYGKLVSPYFDFQTGLRYAQRRQGGRTVSRLYVAAGLQGLAPYRFELEPTLFVSHQGKISARVTTGFDVLLSQRLILQPRLEANLAVQRDEAMGVGSGLNDTDLGLRLRYEVRREFAPYVGVTWLQSYGGTKALLGREGEDARRVSFVAGARVWF